MAASIGYRKLAASMALKAKRGQASPRSLTGEARSMYERMSVTELSEFTKRGK